MSAFLGQNHGVPWVLASPMLLDRDELLCFQLAVLMLLILF
jgi:hypothetical protein